MSHAVVIKNVVKKYGDFLALKGINLEINPGELFTLLGPSGCGKTTLLRLIAGFNKFNEGEIYFDDKKINNLEAYKRNIGMVFQNYAIFPHLTVSENIAYGLKAKKIPKSQIESKVTAALKLMQIEQLKHRKPNELSGGQQQRVALARAFIIEPRVLLMDEPLSNLDAKLRSQMRTVIKKLQRQFGITTIYVTHDQEEALAISDRIAVMENGKIVQVGVPKEIYIRPESIFVAGFIGISNFINCEIKRKKNRSMAVIGDEYSFVFNSKNSYVGKAQICVRPEQLFISCDKGLLGTVIMSTFFGDYIEYEICLSNGTIVRVNEYTKYSNIIYQKDDRVSVDFEINSVNIYKNDSGEVISC